MRENKKVVGYIRISEREGKKHLNKQRESIERYCAVAEYELCAIFEDKGNNGKDINRNGYQEMLTFLSKNDDIEAMIVDRLSRIFTKQNAFLDFIQNEIIPREISFIAIEENFDTGTDQGKETLKVLTSFHHINRVAKTKKARSQKETCLKKEKTVSYVRGELPYGYRVQDGKLVIHQIEANVVKEIFTRYGHGHSPHWIAQFLNQERIPSKRGKKWSHTAIKHVVQNISYAGLRYRTDNEGNSVVPENIFPPIVNKYIWEKARKVTRERAAAEKKTRYRKGKWEKFPRDLRD
ncbi:recombinase family protein [Aneurinibacillus tyrosinisolvens]|uniref:recombinase family protein n=1 Tax=Aneurinibacillus tyrosinisolvens TaxID=1443435 RepID=UPI00063F4A2C|nr:recombinase family protein [Aneurinibacillus tyrosinisolvens]